MVSTPARISMNSSDTRIARKYGHSRALYFFSLFQHIKLLFNETHPLFSPFFLLAQSTVRIGSRILARTRLRDISYFFYTFAIIDYCSNFVSF